MSNKGEPNETPQPEAVTPPEGVKVTVTAPPAPEPEDAIEPEIDAIEERIAALDARVTETVESRDQWTSQTTQTITSLQQEIADLKATLSTVTQSQQQTVQELRDELTRLSLALRKAEEPPETVDTLLVVTPPETPPEPESLSSGDPADQKGQQKPAGKKVKRVV